jgi:hypothetical protein
MRQSLPDQTVRRIGPHSTAGELASRLADLALDTFPSFKSDEQDRVELADHIVAAAVTWINQRHHIVGAASDEQEATDAC